MKNPFSSDKDEEKLKEEVKIDEEKTADENAETENEEKLENSESVEEAKKEEVNPLQEKYDALNNQYIRLAADFDNYRKRQEQEKEALLKYGAEST